MHEAASTGRIDTKEVPDEAATGEELHSSGPLTCALMVKPSSPEFPANAVIKPTTREGRGYRTKEDSGYIWKTQMRELLQWWILYVPPAAPVLPKRGKRTQTFRQAKLEYEAGCTLLKAEAQGVYHGNQRVAQVVGMFLKTYSGICKFH